MATIIDLTEGKRGCGYRKAGGKYLIGGGEAQPCDRFPIPLAKCPTCDCGIKAARGWSWIKLGPMLEKAPPCRNTGAIGVPTYAECIGCVLCNPVLTPERVGLLWVGGAFYDTAADFAAEAARMGISRRLSQVPKGLEIGKTWILLAHRKPEPHAFMMFRPTRLDYVVRGDEKEEELDRLTERGFTLVRVHQKEEPEAQPSLPGTEQKAG